MESVNSIQLSSTHETFGNLRDTSHTEYDRPNIKSVELVDGIVDTVKVGEGFWFYFLFNIIHVMKRKWRNAE